MKQQVLKALANPPRIFYVPYYLAVVNFVVQFMIFLAFFIPLLLFSGGSIAINPLIFISSTIIVHMILAVFSKTEPQLGKIISAKIQLYKHKIPKRLAA